MNHWGRDWWPGRKKFVEGLKALALQYNNLFVWLLLCDDQTPFRYVTVCLAPFRMRVDVECRYEGHPSFGHNGNGLSARTDRRILDGLVRFQQGLCPKCVGGCRDAAGGHTEHRDSRRWRSVLQLWLLPPDAESVESTLSPPLIGNVMNGNYRNNTNNPTYLLVNGFLESLRPVNQHPMV